MSIIEPTTGIAPADEAPDGDLVRHARGGDRGAFSLLHERFAPLVHAVLLVRAPVEEVEDLAQEVFLNAWRALDELREDEAFGPWICATARNAAASAHRSKARRLRHVARRVVRAWFVDRRAAARDVLEEIRALPEAYRETLALRLVEQMSGAEIAARTGMTPGSVRVNLHRGMKLLRERLEGTT